MGTWNERLGRAIDEAGVSKHSLAQTIGVAGPTISVWLGSGNLKAARMLGADHLFSVCKALGVRPEWVLYGTGTMHEPPIVWPFMFSLEQYMALSLEDRHEVETLIHLKIVRSGARE